MLLNKIYNFLKSLELAIGLLTAIAIIIAIASIQSIYPHFLKSIGLYNIYYSWYFKALLMLFLVNLILCTISLTSKTKKLLEVPKKAQKNFTFKAKDIVQKKEHFKSLLRRKHFYFYENNGIILVHRNLIKKFAVYFIHSAIFIIAIGALITSFFGFRGMMFLAQHHPTKTVYLQSGGSFNLPFYVENLGFSVNYYKNTNMPSKYETKGLILTPSTKRPFTVKVNHPFKYKGVWFYQSSYFPQASKTYVVLQINHISKRLYLNKKTKFNNMTFYMKSISEYKAKPVIYLYVFTPLGYASGWLVQNETVSIAGYNLKFKSAKETFVSLLSVSKDPGSPIILVGFIILCLSSFLILLKYKRRSYQIK